jgi:hypothetical protein
MQIAWKRGFFRAWVVITLIWIAFGGVVVISGIRAGMPSVETSGECWDRLARWPDGRAFDRDDPFNDNGEGTLAERDARVDWRYAIRQELIDCQDAQPITQRIGRVINYMDTRDDFDFIFGAILLPPLVLLGFGGIFGWIVTGFRPRT